MEKITLLEKYQKIKFKHIQAVGYGGFVKNGKNRTMSLVFKCECGTLFKKIPRCVLFNTSCGCKRFEQRSRVSKKHGMSKTSIYGIYASMLSRCHSKSDSNYFRYGGRGIEVCQRWRDSFLNFYEDMGDRPRGMTLERIDNNKGYSKENCKWATMMEQCNNRRSSSYVVLNGRKMTKAQASRITGLNQTTIGDYGEKSKDIADLVKLHKPKLKKFKTITVDGKTMTLKEAESIYGIPSKRISARKNRGWTDCDSVKVPMRLR